MYRDVTQWRRIRRRVLTGGVSQKQIERETGISRTTVRKMIEFPIPPGYRRKRAVERPKLGPCLELINHIVKEDQGKSKQQHTARQIWESLKEKLGFTGGLTIVTDYVREARHRAASGSQSDPSLLAISQPSLSPKIRPNSLMSSCRLCPKERRSGCFV
jgi:transposase